MKTIKVLKVISKVIDYSLGSFGAFLLINGVFDWYEIETSGTMLGVWILLCVFNSLGWNRSMDQSMKYSVEYSKMIDDLIEVNNQLLNRKQ